MKVILTADQLKRIIQLEKKNDEVKIIAKTLRAVRPYMNEKK